MCKYCEEAADFEIGETYGRYDTARQVLQLFVDGDEGEKFLGINLECSEVDDGFYVDIKYCPMCGRKL